MGDPGKVLILERVIKVIKEQCLLDQVNATGKVLKSGLHELEKEFPHLLHSVRGRGTFLAVNATKAELRDDIVKKIKQKGNILFN